MALSYNKLWKLLIDKNLKKSDLHELIGLSQSTIAKLTRGENVNTDVLEKICNVLNCEIGISLNWKKTTLLDDLIKWDISAVKHCYCIILKKLLIGTHQLQNLYVIYFLEHLLLQDTSKNGTKFIRTMFYIFHISCKWLL